MQGRERHYGVTLLRWSRRSAPSSSDDEGHACLIRTP